MTHSTEHTPESFLSLLQSKLGTQIVESSVSLDIPVVRIRKESALDFFKLLKLDSELRFNLLLDVTCVDWMDKGEERYEVVYHLLSLATRNRLRVKMWVPESKPEVDSISELWSGADFLEREAWDMYGVKFRGHPDLRRVLMYDEFKGHPLRKDYPVQGKQPRVQLRSPEVRNTAVDMKRAPLITINPRKQASNA